MLNIGNNNKHLLPWLDGAEEEIGKFVCIFLCVRLLLPGWPSGLKKCVLCTSPFQVYPWKTTHASRQIGKLRHGRGKRRRPFGISPCVSFLKKTPHHQQCQLSLLFAKTFTVYFPKRSINLQVIS